MDKKICFIVTVSMAAKNFLVWSFDELHNAGYDITLVCDMDDEFKESLPKYVHAVPLKMSRGIDFKNMLMCIRKLKRIFKQNKFDIIQYSTPNGALYSSIAGFFARVPIRLYCQWGLVYLGYGGFKGKLLKFLEKLSCRLSTFVQPDSHGNLYLCREQGFYSEKKSCVIWNGSANGVDLEKFDISQKDRYRKEIFSEMSIPFDAKTIGFLGRIGRDKGFNELIASFKKLKEKYGNLKLIYVGYNERPDTVDSEMLDYFFDCEDIISTNGYASDPQRYLSAMDVFVFPSYREGFGNVVAEAQAMGVPVVASDIPGPQNCVIDGKTGFLTPKKDVDALTDKISVLLDDDKLRQEMSKNASEHIKANFDSKILIHKIIENRDALIAQRIKNKG